MLREEAAQVLADAAGGGQPRDGDFLFYYQGEWNTVPLSGMAAAPQHEHPEYLLRWEAASQAEPVNWSDIVGVPETASRWPSFSEVTDKPSTYPASAHNHDDLYARLVGDNNLSGTQFVEGSLFSPPAGQLVGAYDALVARLPESLGHPATLDARFQIGSFLFNGYRDPTFSFVFNPNEAAGLPKAASSRELMYVSNVAQPWGNFEHHETYVSPDRSVAWRYLFISILNAPPYTSIVNWRQDQFDIQDRNGATALSMTTGAQGGLRLFRPLIASTASSQLTLQTVDSLFRLAISVQNAGTFGTFEFLANRYAGAGGSPQGYGYMRFFSRSMMIASEASLAPGFFWQGGGVGGDHVGMRLARAGVLVEGVYAGNSGDAQNWQFAPANSAKVPYFCFPNLGVWANTVAQFSAGVGVLAIGAARTVPGTPPPGTVLLYVDPADGKLKRKDSTGVQII